MAESGDNSPTGESELDEESDVVELTDEVAVAPTEDESSDPESDTGAEGEDESDEYDRQEMVKTVQMDAVDRESVEAAKPDVDPAEAALLDDARFSPEIIPEPPEVLVKKWREGRTANIEEIIGEEPDAEIEAADDEIAEAETAEMEQPPGPDEQPDNQEAGDGADQEDDNAEVEQPEDEDVEEELDDSDLEEVEPIELDEDLVELEEDEDDQSPPKSSPPRQPEGARKSTPPPTTAPSEKKNKDGDGAAPADQSGEPTMVSSKGDSEMSGLVEELLEEERREKEEEELGPRQTWFKNVFTEEYLRSVPEDITEVTEKEADFIEKSLRLKKGSRIFDLACGFGRHSLELAHRGYEMVGLDLSMPLLQHALDAAQKRSLDIKFIHGDMRDLNFSGVFDGCFCWNTSLGYFDDQTNLGVLHSLYRGLKVGGRLLVDVVNRDHVVQQTPTRLWWEGKGCIFLEETEFDHQTSTLQIERSYIYEDGTPPVEHTYYIRLYNVHELRQMLHVAGFKVLEVSGERHHKGYFLGPASRRIIILAEKRQNKRAPSSAGSAGGSDSG